jgi:feruloyl esterase
MTSTRTLTFARISALALATMLPTTMLPATAAAATTCESLTGFTIAQGTITSAAVVGRGPYVQPGRAGGAPAATRGGGPAGPVLPEHCRIVLVLKPSSDSNINAELWLPTTTWNGKFMAVGNGGFGGSIQGYSEMATALGLGYATAGSDTGHSNDVDGPGGTFALGHPEKIVDFSHRALHEMTAKSKQLIDQFYGKAPQFSYYKGCSTGGRMGVMAAQRFPEDFDGIIAGALANRHIQMHTAGTARSIQLTRHPEEAIPPAKAAMVTKAVLDTCDTYKEGFLNNPRACTFDFKQLACKGADADSCLTAPQLKTVETFYGGLKNSKGELLFSGQALGNPLPALRGAAEGAAPNVSDTVKIWAFQNPNYDWKTFDLDRDMPIINSKVGFVDAVDPDLSKFKARGGKLLLYAGWGDTGITPENTVLYYESVLSKMGKDQDNFTRLFLAPGMAHCRGGDGPNTFDTIGTLEAWREKGVTPAQMIAFNPQTSLSRPLCPYPQFAKYKGTGNLKDASNWSCAAP